MATPRILPPTEMLYLTYDGNFQYECKAQLLSIEKQPQEEGDDAPVVVSVCLNKTVMHAQGGGQPTDKGRIQINKNSEESLLLDIHKVSIDRTTGIVTHTGTVVNSSSSSSSSDTMIATLQEQIRNGSATTTNDNNAHIRVDTENRQLLSECHTAGHVVDAAMYKIGKCMKPTKGYHFLDGPYVEYEGSIEAGKVRDETLQELKTVYQQLLEEDIATNIQLLSPDEANTLCNRRIETQDFDIDAFTCPRTHTVRVVTVGGFSCPCGGTHVKTTKDLKTNGWNVTGIKSKKGVVRIKYGMTNTK